MKQEALDLALVLTEEANKAESELKQHKVRVRKN